MITPGGGAAPSTPPWILRRYRGVAVVGFLQNNAGRGVGVPRRLRREKVEVTIYEEMMISHDPKVEFQNKKYVTFGNPQPLAKTHVVPQGNAVLGRYPSLRIKKYKSLMPLFGFLFLRKKGSTDAAGATTEA
ncbi:hypothetical protein AgCh_014127 [Apium graveolens]